jgi:aldo/keto reductase family protein
VQVADPRVLLWSQSHPPSAQGATACSGEGHELEWKKVGVTHFPVTLCEATGQKGCPLGPYPDHDHAVRVLRGVVDAGVSLIDAADVHGPHANELLIEKAFHPYPEGLIIATKAGLVRGAATRARSMRLATRTTCGRAPA